MNQIIRLRIVEFEKALVMQVLDLIHIDERFYKISFNTGELLVEFNEVYSDFGVYSVCIGPINSIAFRSFDSNETRDSFVVDLQYSLANIYLDNEPVSVSLEY